MQKHVKEIHSNSNSGFWDLDAKEDGVPILFSIFFFT